MKILNDEFYLIKVAAESEAVIVPPARLESNEVKPEEEDNFVAAKSDAVPPPKPISETQKERPGLETNDKIKPEVKFESIDIRLKQTLKSTLQPKKTSKNLKKKVYIFSKST